MGDIKELLTSCDNEPIHIPGRIQSHGYLFAFEKATGLLISYSENAAALLPSTADLSSFTFNDLFRNEVFSQTKPGKQLLDKLFSPDAIKNQISTEIKIGNESWFLIGHECAKKIIIELEAQSNDDNKKLEYIIEDLVSYLFPDDDYFSMLQKVTEVIHKISGYQRVMVYRFLDDGSGEVLTEIKNETDSPYLGQHFPASDIPKQARELYKKNHIRLISDVNNNNVPIVSVGLAQPLDLTNAVLRAVSPAHIEYLKNMGVAASFSISILVKGELWGLIACHHPQPKFLDFREREVLKLVGKILSSNLELKISEESGKKVKYTNEIISKVFREILEEPEFENGLQRVVPYLPELSDSSGAAILYNDKIFVTGTTPTEHEIKNICSWLKEANVTDVYHTNELSLKNPAFEPIRQVASGLMAVIIKPVADCNAILWFRPEAVETIRWAGKPEKKESIDINGLPVISPRRSFAQWGEIVRNKSRKWTGNDVSSAVKLRADVEKLMALKNNESELISHFKESYAKMESFGFTISHDLKTPLSALTSYAEILRDESENLNDFQISLLEKISAAAKKMNDLINGAIYYSRMDKQVVNKSELNMAEILQDIKEEISVVYKDYHPEIEIENTVPLYGDRNMIIRLFTNLISNGVKFSTDKETPRITITGEVQKDRIVYNIADNGIGIPQNAGNKIFESFIRQENASNYEGTGIGLSTVKKIVTRHNGNITYTSKTGEGTIFTITLPNEI